MGNTIDRTTSTRTSWQVSAKDVIMTKTGPKLVDHIKHDEIVEISTNIGWAPVRRTAIKYGPMVRIDISDGTHFSVSPDALISVGYGDVVKASELKFEDKLMPLFNDNMFENNYVIDWLDHGKKYGAKAIKGIQHDYIFPHDRESCLDFIEGWSIAQNGHITGSEYEIMCMYHIFRIAEIHEIFIEQVFDGRYKLLASSVHFQSKNFKWNMNLSKRFRFVSLVQYMPKSRICHFEFTEDADNVKIIDLGMVAIHTDKITIDKPLAREYSVAITPPDSPVDKKNISPASSISEDMEVGETKEQVIISV